MTHLIKGQNLFASDWKNPTKFELFPKLEEGKYLSQYNISDESPE